MLTPKVYDEATLEQDLANPQRLMKQLARVVTCLNWLKLDKVAGPPCERRQSPVIALSPSGHCGSGRFPSNQ
jgi:hypothetical protein